MGGRLGPRRPTTSRCPPALDRPASACRSSAASSCSTELQRQLEEGAGRSPRAGDAGRRAGHRQDAPRRRVRPPGARRRRHRAVRPRRRGGAAPVPTVRRSPPTHRAQRPTRRPAWRCVGDDGGRARRACPGAPRAAARRSPEPVRSDPESERFRLFEAATALFAHARRASAGGAGARRPALGRQAHAAAAAPPVPVARRHRGCSSSARTATPTSTAATRWPRRSPTCAAWSSSNASRVGGLVDRRPDRVPRPASPAKSRRPSFAARAARPDRRQPVLHRRGAAPPRRDRRACRSSTGEWVPTVDLEQLGIPEGVKEVIGRRLTRLSDDANAALAVGAVAGRDFDLDVLERITELDEDTLLAALDEAVDRPPRGRAPRQRRPLPLRARAGARDAVRRADDGAARADAPPHRADARGVCTADADRRSRLLAYHCAEAAQADDVDKSVDYARRAAEQRARAVRLRRGGRPVRAGAPRPRPAPSAPTTLCGATS